MNWLTNLYFREGPGIPKDAPRPKGLRLLWATFAREWWTLIQLNLLFALFCLPVVTAPAAYFAMVTIVVTMIEDRNVWLWRDFWGAFRSRFGLTTLLGFAFAAAAALGVLAVRSYAAAAVDSVLFAAPLTLALVVTVLLPLYASHVFVALVLGEDRSLAAALRAGAVGLIVRPLPGLAALGLVGLLWLAHVHFYPASVFLPVLVNFSLGALVLSFAALKGTQFGFSHASGRVRNGRPEEPDTQSASISNGGEHA